MELKMKLISPLEKVFLDEEPVEKPEAGPIEGFQNETISFQVAFSLVSPDARLWVWPKISSPLEKYIRVRTVRHVPVRFACLPDSGDNYLRKTPGLYPDLLRDVVPHKLHAYHNQWDTLWIDVEPNGEVAPGTYPVEVAMLREATGEELDRLAVNVTILPGELPRQTLIHTKWFHYDCLAHYYRVPVFSEEFWRITENFMRAAVKRGINMMLMPIHTPPLDTREGCERLTVQLVDVYQNGGVYSFGFDKLRRWVEMARRCGVEYFEAAHLFTQWGARATPKIMATVDGEYKRIFGWDVAADSDAYRNFLDAYLPALLAELKALGIDRRCWFHISDEPSEDHLENYLKAKAMVAKHLEGYTIMDALSNFKFYESGAVAKPVPAINHMDDFVAAGIPGLWTYYCVGQHKDVSNTFVAMPSARTRVLGVQLYKYDIEGFLQWGYNFYGTQYSDFQVDPYAVTDGEAFTPAGDCFQVYPGEAGEPEESIRMMVACHALQDLRAMRLLEALRGREAVMALVEEGLSEPISFTRYPKDAMYLLTLRRRINRAIVEAQAK
ncbi:MAG: DUF4091 domain-containing protein [Clostridia bacterium]|nr:DUF4091 domain-containing protein [Clostridia bacterium]